MKGKITDTINIDAIKGEGEKTKKYYHTLRLLGEAERICDGLGPKVWMEGEEREFLLEVRTGKHDEAYLFLSLCVKFYCGNTRISLNLHSELTNRVTEMQKRVEEKLAANKTLPDVASSVPLTIWLVGLRRARINKFLMENPQGNHFSYQKRNLTK